MSLFRIIGLMTAAAILAACQKTSDTTFQGWVEADLIYVGPDESGRLESLRVREGDSVETGRFLFAVDPELQQADVDTAMASLANAKIAYERATSLLKTASGTQKAVDDAEAVMRTEMARLNAANPLDPPQDGKPIERVGPGNLLPARRIRRGWTTGGVTSPAK